MDIISVIVPVYNVEKYLPKCLDSLSNQTFQSLEIVLVDDGSTDNSGQICDEYAAKDARIKVLHKTNGGVSSARNAGLDAATGNYIAFADSDDYVEPDMYEILYKAVDVKTVACCGLRKINSDNNIELFLPLEKVYTREEYIELLLENELPPPLFTKKVRCISNNLWTKLFPKACFLKTRFLEGANYEDMYVSVEVLKNIKNVRCVAACKYNYVKRKGSITNTNNAENYQSCLLARLKQESDLSEYPSLAEKAKVLTCNAALSLYAYTGGQDKNQINIEKIKKVIEERTDHIFVKWEYNRIFLKYIVAYKVPILGRILLKMKNMLK
ncbi:glycosyltransferase family 2 protein [Phascolarctobacterium sp.]